MAARSARGSAGQAGIRTFGFTESVSAMKRMTLSGVLGRIPAPTVARAPKRVRSGPTSPFASVPAIAWQAPQPFARNRSRPFAGSADVGAGPACAASQPSKAGFSMTTTENAISAWLAPQNSAQTPR